VLDLFVEEVKTYTEGMDVTNGDGDDDPLQAVIAQEGDDE